MSSETADQGGGGDGSSEAQNVALAEVNVVTSYLRHITNVLLEGDVAPSQALIASLDSKEYQDNVRKFISDTQTRALFIQRHSVKGNFFYLLFCSHFIIKLNMT